ncbi:unnamed protein product [Leptidea sinapis]|uniref:Uncharacterized protein n=1 Tax=Leptidea sinapis TaxID=189913 RepID=A0A5E4QIV9_9NEOP|nr:unnamed protein product [Leptidea sinapis]
MMKIFAVMFVLVVVSTAKNFDHYETREDIDIDLIMSQKEIVVAYLDCFLERKKCDPLLENYKASN